MIYQITQDDLKPISLGEPKFLSPFANGANTKSKFISDSSRVAYNVLYDQVQSVSSTQMSFELTGPREKIFFDPKKTIAAIVTCGGISPGINSVIRSLVSELHSYGCKKILGIRYGYKGLVSTEHAPIELNIDMVDEIHLKGGSILGSSRGSIDPKQGVSFLQKNKVNILFCVGGDGTLRGALALSEAAKEIGYEISVIGIPKTIDNDVPFVFQSFGFLTAVEKAKDVIIQAHTEVSSYQRTLAIVKLMGREAGFIAVHACLAAQLADIALIPEVGFELNNPQNPNSLFHRITNVLEKKDACVLVVAEGAGQNLFNGEDTIGVDPSGNRKLNDIGIRLVHECKKYFTAGNLATVKYFDPSYSIRAVPANVADSMLCDGLARAAVHAAFAGKTEIIIGLWHNNLTHVPIRTVCKFQKRVNPEGSTWKRLESTLF